MLEIILGAIAGGAWGFVISYFVHAPLSYLFSAAGAALLGWAIGTRARRF